MILKKKSAPELTLEQQLAQANVVASNALTAFTNAATTLEVAADKLDAIRDAAAEEANRHLATKLNANELAFKHRSQALKIRELIG